MRLGNNEPCRTEYLAELNSCPKRRREAQDPRNEVKGLQKDWGGSFLIPCLLEGE